jgi:hypothetical protein
MQVDDILSWDRSLESALALRQQMHERAKKAPPKQRVDDDETLLRWVQSAYRARKPHKLLLDLDVMGDERSLAKARIAAPFLGDPAIESPSSVWPWKQLDRLDDEALLPSLTLLARFGCVDDDGILRMFLELFAARRRSTWVKASRALAEYALHSRQALAALQRQWADAFPHGPVWNHRQLMANSVNGADGHTRRHMLHAVCTTFALTGHAHGFAHFDLDTMLAQPLPDEASDASALLLAIDALLDGVHCRQDALRWLKKNIANVRTEFQAETALRNMLPKLDSDSRETVFQVLLAPRWRELRAPTARFDALYSWIESAHELHPTGAEASLAVMRAQAQEALPCLELRVNAAWNGPIVDSLCERLALLLSPTLFATTPPAEQVIACVELVWLLRQPAAQSLPWPVLVERAIGTPLPGSGEGDVASAAEIDVAIWLAERQIEPKCLLHDLVIDDQTRLLRLVACQSGMVARQAAIQLERHLRNPFLGASGEDTALRAERLKLLWRVLQHRPHKHLFPETVKMLRTDAGELEPVLTAIQALLFPAPNAKRLESANAYQRLAHAASTYLPANNALRDHFHYLAEHIPAVAQLDASPELSGWWHVFSPLFVGAPPVDTELGERISGGEPLNRGLVGWMAWLGLAFDDFDACWKAFDESAAELDRTKLDVSEAVCDDFERCLAQLACVFEPLPWPERMLAKLLLDSAGTWLEQKRSRSRRSRRLSARLHQALSNKDELWLRKMVDTGGTRPSAPEQEDTVVVRDLDYLPESDLRALNDFFLSQLHFDEHKRLRAMVRGRQIVLPSSWRYYASLYIAVTAGSFLTLDFGEAWNDVVVRGQWLPFGITVVLAQAMSFGLIWCQLDAPPPTVQHFRRLRRVVPLFATALCFAVVSSAVVLWTLDGTAIREPELGEVIPFLPQLALWSSLALFFGVFMGLILGGRRIGSSSDTPE